MSEMQPIEREWLAQYRRGDLEALGRLVEQYRRPLYSFILKMTEGRGDPEEIFQETWIRAIRNLDRFNDRNLLGWLFRIAHNLVVDRVRKGHVEVKPTPRTGQTTTAWFDQVASSNLGPATVAAGRDLGSRIEEALESLPAEQREVFLLRMEGNLSFKEIAHIQQVSINTALARMHYAVRKLRGLLKDAYENL
jgi:RNA polymerase sigma-70 factor (ECF subfamily)